MRKGKRAGSENWAGAILTISLPLLIQGRSERCVPPFKEKAGASALRKECFASGSGCLYTPNLISNR